MADLRSEMTEAAAKMAIELDRAERVHSVLLPDLRKACAEMHRAAISLANVLEQANRAAPEASAHSTISEEVTLLHGLLGPDWTPRQVAGRTWELRHDRGLWFKFSGFVGGDRRVPKALVDAALDEVMAGRKGEVSFAMSITPERVKVDVL